MTGTRAVIAAWGALLLGVTACSGSDPEPHVAAPSSSAPSSPSTSPAAADLGPKATFSAWVQARNAALRTGDTSDVEDLSTGSCRTCRNSIEPIKNVYDNGGHFDTAGWAVVASRVKSQSGNRAEVSAAIRYAAGETVPETGADPVTYEVERHIVTAELVRTDFGWRVQFLGYLS